MINFYIPSLCPKCYSYPILKLNQEEPKDLLIECTYCGYNQYYSLHHYLNLMKKIPLQQNESIKYCKIHHQIFNKYCSTCNIHLCSQCLNHLSHKLISFDTKMNTNFFSFKINEGFNHINNYCLELKNIKIKMLLNQINHLEYSYLAFQTVNNDKLNLLQIIINNYKQTQNNYYLRYNLLNFIGKINIYYPEYERTVENIIQYLDNYSLVIDSFVNITEKKTIYGHTEGVLCLLLMSDGRLASCSNDQKIKIYNMKQNFNCDMTIIGHIQKVTSICQLDYDRIVSCSWDKTIKIWKVFLTSYHCEYNIEDAHSSEIRKVITLTNHRFASCSQDKTIKIWNSDHPYNLICVLEGHTNDVYSILQVKGKNILASGSYDNTLRLWNISSYQCKRVVSNIKCWSGNSLIELDEERIISCGNKTIKIVNINKSRPEQKYKDEKLNSIGSIMKINNRSILCGSYKMACIYDIKNNIISQFIKLHDDAIYDFLRLDDHQFLSCSQDWSIKLWEF